MVAMRWRIVLSIASLGAAVGLASVFGLTRGIETWLWVAIGVVAALVIARALPSRRFLHGFAAGGLAGLAAPVIQAAMLPTYAAHDPQLAASLSQIPRGVDPRLFFLATAPVIGALSGLVVGLLSWVAGRVVGQRTELALTALVLAIAAPASAQEPELVQPGVISLDDRNETFPSIDPLDGAVWFSVYDDNFNAQTIMVARSHAGRWGAAEVAFFSGQWGDRAPRFSPDGDRLYFSSNRPTPGYPEKDWNVWVIERSEDRTWSEPVLVGPPVSVPGASDYHVAVIGGGTLYVPSNRGGGRGDVYRVEPDGAIEPRGAANHDSLSQPDLYVEPGGRWMILVISDHPNGLGGDDLFVSRFVDGEWSAPEHIAAPINSDEYEYGPTVSPDGWLYFTSHRRGTADVWRVSLEALGLAP